MTAEGWPKEYLISSLVENSKNKLPIPSYLSFAVFRDAAVRENPHLLDVNLGFLFSTCSFIHYGPCGHEAQVPIDFQNEKGEQRLNALFMAGYKH